MSLYLSPSDLSAVIPETEFLQLTDRTNDPPTTADAAVVAMMISAAEGRLHRALARRYKLPLPATDAILLGILKPILVDFAWEAGATRPDMSDPALLDRTAAHDKYLLAIAKGEEDLPSTEPLPPPTATSGSGIQWSADPRKIGEMP